MISISEEDFPQAVPEYRDHSTSARLSKDEHQVLDLAGEGSSIHLANGFYQLRFGTRIQMVHDIGGTLDTAHIARVYVEFTGRTAFPEFH